MAQVLEALLLVCVTGLPAPTLSLGFPEHGGVHNLRFDGLDREDRGLLFADEYKSDRDGIEWEIHDDIFCFWRCGTPAPFSVPKITRRYRHVRVQG